MIYAWAQMFHTTPDYILHGISYQNLLLYNKAIPTYNTDPKKEEKEWDDRLDANNPDNFNDFTDLEYE